MDDLVQRLETEMNKLADDIVGRMLAKKPDLYERYSEVAPQRTREDVVFHLQHLAGALTAEDPDLYREYYEWLLRILLPRGIIQEDIDLNFDCMTESLREAFGSEADVALSYIEAARIK